MHRFGMCAKQSVRVSVKLSLLPFTFCRLSVPTLLGISTFPFTTCFPNFLFPLVHFYTSTHFVRITKYEIAVQKEGLKQAERMQRRGMHWDHHLCVKKKAKPDDLSMCKKGGRCVQNII